MPTSSAVDLPSFTTLVVDDSIAYRKAMCGVLKSVFPFLRVIEASTVEVAKIFYAGSQVDLTFVDIRLPDGNGLDLVRTLRRRANRSEFCVMSVFDAAEYQQAARASGADYFLAKSESTPVDQVAMVEAIMRQRRRPLPPPIPGAISGRIGCWGLREGRRQEGYALGRRGRVFRPVNREMRKPLNGVTQ